jgi:hypothetical protein
MGQHDKHTNGTMNGHLDTNHSHINGSSNGINEHHGIGYQSNGSGKMNGHHCHPISETNGSSSTATSHDDSGHLFKPNDIDDANYLREAYETQKLAVPVSSFSFPCSFVPYSFSLSHLHCLCPPLPQGDSYICIGGIATIRIVDICWTSK